jgi:FkbM family methyltransferase
MGTPTPKKENLIYDVGLHQGQDTDFYLRKGFNVIAFEANSENIAICKQKFSDAIESGQLTIVEGAIVENPSVGKVNFYRNKDHSLWGSTNEDWAYRNEVMGTTNEVVEVDAVDFKQCLEQFGIPHYLKVDIVGSEMICLKTLLAFDNKPDYLSIRSEKVIFRKLEEEFRVLELLGYDKFKAVQQDFTNLQAFIDSPASEKIRYTFHEGASGPFGEETKGKWKSKEAILKDYRRIFILYWLFGDYSYLNQSERGGKFLKFLERLVRRPLPGWYDTHAKHRMIVRTMLGCVLTGIAAP